MFVFMILHLGKMLKCMLFSNTFSLIDVITVDDVVVWFVPHAPEGQL